MYLRGGGPFEGLNLAARSPDGGLVAGGGVRSHADSFTSRVVLWNAATMERRWVTDRPTTDFRSVNALLWSPDGRAIWTHDTEGKIDRLDSQSGRVTRELQGHQYAPCVFASTPGGLLLTEAASRNAPTELTLRSWKDGEVRWRVPFPCWWEAGSSVNAAGTLLAYSPRRGEVALFDLRRRVILPARFHFPAEAGPYAIALTPDGSAVAAGWNEGTITTWNTAGGREVWRARPHRGLVRALAWNARGDALASSAFHGCGGWRSECVVVTRPDVNGPQSRVAWWRRYHVADSLQWLGEDRLMLAINDGAFTVRVPP